MWDLRRGGLVGLDCVSVEDSSDDDDDEGKNWLFDVIEGLWTVCKEE